MSDLAVSPAGSRAVRLDTSARPQAPRAPLALVTDSLQPTSAPARNLISADAGQHVAALQPARRATEPQTVAARARAARDGTAAAIRDVEVRQSFNGGICGVYNEASRQVEWRSVTAAGVAGVYDPASRSVRWYSEPGQAIAAVRNPLTGEIQVERNPNGGIAGVFDPIEQRPYFESGNRNEGIALVVDPSTSEIEPYRTPRRPVVGYIDPQTRLPRFEAGQMDGIAVVYRDGSTYRSACAYLPSQQLPRPDPFPQPPMPPIPQIPRR